MRIAKAAKELGISERSIYRLVRDGSLPATVKVRDSPLIGYDISETIVLSIKKDLDANKVKPSPAQIRSILQQIKPSMLARRK